MTDMLVKEKLLSQSSKDTLSSSVVRWKHAYIYMVLIRSDLTKAT